MLHLLVGEDGFSIHQALEKLKQDLGDPALIEANTTTLDAQGLTVEQLRTACESAPFLAPNRLIIIRGLLERFEAKARAGKKARAMLDLHELASCLTDTPQTATVVLIDGKIKGDNPLFKEIAPRAKLRAFPLLGGAVLREWIGQRVAACNGNISREAVELLAGLVGGDLWTMANEIDKLLVFTAGNRINAGDVRIMVSAAGEAAVFNMVDAILESRLRAAQSLAQDHLQRGAAPVFLLTMLARQAHLTLRAKGLIESGLSDMRVQKQLGLGDYATRKTLLQAQRCSTARLKEVYHRLLETDVAIKTGKCEGELALNLLVAGLCQDDRQEDEM